MVVKTKVACPLVGQVLVQLARKHNAGGKRFYCDFAKGTVFCTVDEALGTWPTSVLSLPSMDLGPVRFYGGPPQKSRWYTGSLFTVLKDMELFALATSTDGPTTRPLPFIEKPAPFQVT